MDESQEGHTTEPQNAEQAFAEPDAASGNEAGRATAEPNAARAEQKKQEKQEVEHTAPAADRPAGRRDRPSSREEGEAIRQNDDDNEMKHDKEHENDMASFLQRIVNTHDHVDAKNASEKGGKQEERG